jgi:hypothetical protein
MDDTMHFNLSSSDDVEYKVGVDHQNAISVFSELLVTRYPSKHWMPLKRSYALVELVHERTRSIRAILSNEVEN